MISVKTRKEAHDRRLRLTLVPPARLTLELLRELWTVRLANIQLRPEVDEAADFAEFVSVFDRTGAGAAVFRDTRGQVRGFYSFFHTPREVDGKRCVIFGGDYLFFDDPYRGHPLLVFSEMRTLLIPMLRHILHPQFVTGVVYPNSYVLLSTTISRHVWNLRHVDITERARTLLIEHARSIYAEAFDAATSVVRLPTIPPADVSHLRQHPEHRTIVDAYERYNPRWREGYGLAVILPAGLETMRMVGINLLHRLFGTHPPQHLLFPHLFRRQ